MQFRQGVAIARHGSQLVLEFRGVVLYRGSAGDMVMPIAVKLLGGLPRSVLEEGAATAEIAHALSVWQRNDLIREYDNIDDVESASRLQELFHRRGWSGAISLLESTQFGSPLGVQASLGKVAGPSIPVRVSTEVPWLGPAPAVERALQSFPACWGARVLPVSLQSGVGEVARNPPISITSDDIRNWMPVLYRSGLCIGYVVLLVCDAIPQSPSDLVHRQLLAGVVTRAIEAELQSDGFGYLAHTWLAPGAQARFGPEPVVVAVAVEGCL